MISKLKSPSNLEPHDYLSLDSAKKRFYMSPEQYRLLIRKDYSLSPKHSYDMTKSDVYTVGLIMLELGLMESNNDIYMEYDVD